MKSILNTKIKTTTKTIREGLILRTEARTTRTVTTTKGISTTTTINITRTHIKTGKITTENETIASFKKMKEVRREVRLREHILRNMGAYIEKGFAMRNETEREYKKFTGRLNKTLQIVTV